MRAQVNQVRVWDVCGMCRLLDLDVPTPKPQLEMCGL